MGYRVHCDWCGEALYEVDQAILNVTVHRKADGTKLGRKWAEEVRPTLHFCVAPKPDADEYNRMGLEAPEEEGESCFTRAMAMIHRAEREGIERPDMGMEWRLMPVGSDAGKGRHNAKPRAPSARNDDRPPNGGAEPELRAALQRAGYRCLHALPRAGITTLGQVEAMSDDELLAIPGVGRKTVDELRDAIEARKSAKR